MSSIVDDLLKLAEESNRQAEEKRKAGIKEQVEQLRRFISPLLGKLLEAGAQTDELEYATHNEGQSVTHLQACVSVPGLLPFWLVAKPFGPDQAHVSYQTCREGSHRDPGRESLVVNAADDVAWAGCSWPAKRAGRRPNRND